MLTVPVAAMPAYADLVLPWQIRLLKHVAVWGQCAQRHGLQQRLATLLLLPPQDSQWPSHTWRECFDAPPAKLHAVLEDLQQLGAISVENGRLLITDRHALTAQACSCLSVLQEMCQGVREDSGAQD